MSKVLDKLLKKGAENLNIKESYTVLRELNKILKGKDGKTGKPKQDSKD